MIRIAICSSWIVVIGLAPEAAAESLRIVETEQTLVVMRNDRQVLTYNKVSPPVPDGIDPIYRRSGCLHPVMSPQGHTVTAVYPVDHAHQQGVFFAWVNTTYDGHHIDFWNLARRTGRVLHERVVSKSQEHDRVSFEVDLLHRKETPPVTDILRERWKITVYQTPSTYHCFDIELLQTAITDTPLVVEKYHYGGLAFRGPVRWLTADHARLPGETVSDREPCTMINSLGSDRKQGNHEHVKWVAVSARDHGQPVTIAVFDHPSNFRSPQAARLHPTKPYFCFAPCVDGQFVINRRHPYRGKYRVLVTDNECDPKWLDQQWNKWCAQ